jgi:hemoglobin
MASDRPSIYETVGGQPAFLAFAAALHERCLEDPVLNHPFSHPSHPQHLEHLASYLAETFGGPPLYSQTLGGHSAMLSIHAATGASDEMPTRFAACFNQAFDDATFPDDPELRRAMSDYITWATAQVHGYSPLGSVVPDDQPIPHWSWNGLEPQ